MTANTATAATATRHPSPSPANARFPDFPLRNNITSGELERGTAFGAAEQAEPADAADERYTKRIEIPVYSLVPVCG